MIYAKFVFKNVGYDLRFLGRLDIKIKVMGETQCDKASDNAGVTG